MYKGCRYFGTVPEAKNKTEAKEARDRRRIAVRERREDAELTRPKPKKTGKYPRLNTMNDLYSLELSQVLLQAMDAGMIEPEASDDGWIFHVPMRRAHMMVNLPKRLMCIEAESAELPTAA